MPEPEEKPDPPESGGGDVAKLKGALEKERELRKAAEKKAGELQGSVTDLEARFAAIEKEHKAASAKLGAYELGEKRRAALDKAVTAAGDKIVVDREKAEKLIAKLGNAETLDADVAEIVATLATPKTAPERKVSGQPETKPENTAGKSLTQLYRENPEGFKAAAQEGAKKAGYFQTE